MTFEEFKKMTGAEPEINCKSIFKVEMIFIERWDMNDDGEKITPYVESTTLDFDVPEINYFLTFEDVKKQILSEQSIHTDSFHSARVIELPIGLPIHDGEYLSVTVLDRNNDISYRSKFPVIDGLPDNKGNDVSTKFYGYPEDDMPFHKGEIVEVMDEENDVVRLGIVVNAPFSLEDNWKVWRWTHHDMDEPDEFKIRTDENECGYYHTDMIFKPSFPISDGIRNQLHKWYEKWQSKDTSDFSALLEML